MRGFLLLMGLFLITQPKAWASESVSIYYNEACSDCKTYIENLKPTLAKYNLAPNLKDYINKPAYRKELSEDNSIYKIPLKLQDSLTVFLKPNLVIEGHVPLNLIEELLKNYESLPKHKLIVLYQPEMHTKVDQVTLYIYGYEPEKVYVNENISNIIHGKALKIYSGLSANNLLVPVIIGAVSNSLHPCAIAVLLLLLTFLYTIHKRKKEIVGIGLSYIAGIFVVYFLIGLGLLRAISLSDEPFFVAKVASIVLVILGLINVKDYFFPELPVHLRIPDFTKGAIQNFMEKASIPAAFAVGALVGICAFPCTGGIYTVIISTLAATDRARFLTYLFLYNFIFILPLLLVVLAATNRKMLEKVEELELKNSRRLHLLTGLLMVVIGLAVYYWIKVIIYG